MSPRYALWVNYDEGTQEVSTTRNMRPQLWDPAQVGAETVERVRTVRGFGNFTGLFRVTTMDVVWYYLVQEGPE